MTIDWWTLALQAINVLVLLYILSRFLFRPVVAMMAERQAAATRDLDAARAARAAAEAEQAKATAETAAISATRKDRLDAATAEAQAQKDALLAAARAEAEALRAAAATDIARARATAAREDADRASRLAVDIAARLLARVPAALQVSAFIDDLAAGVAALPEASRAALVAAEGPLRLKAPRPLTDPEVRACRDRLAAALGRDVTLTLEVEPALIAGLQLDAPHAVVRNTFRADLDRILKELTHHGTRHGT
ncbi:F0F1 ATP synthase subunit B family protein [Xanthobacter agilis]|uniref:F0F1 ATP synthase subunit B family protein n=1 Tax=Xanthobacter agilis TaxID=47492 RepID=UPI00372817B8